MNLDWNEYVSGIKIRRWDESSGEYKYSIDIDLQEDELGFTQSVVGQHKSNRQIYDLPEDCTELLGYLKRSKIEAVPATDIKECIGGKTHYIFSYYTKDGHRVDGIVNEGTIQSILDWVRSEYNFVAEIAAF